MDQKVVGEKGWLTADRNTIIQPQIYGKSVTPRQGSGRPSKRLATNLKVYVEKSELLTIQYYGVQVQACMIKINNQTLSGRESKTEEHMSLYSAKQQIAENLRLFGNAQSQPEKFNLYNGLLNIIDSLSQMESDITRINNTVEQIKRRQQ